MASYAATVFNRLFSAGFVRGKHDTELAIAAAFSRSCRERDLELAEFLLQDPEAIAEREGSEERVEEAFGELLHVLPIGGAH